MKDSVKKVIFSCHAVVDDYPYFESNIIMHKKFSRFERPEVGLF